MAKQRSKVEIKHTTMDAGKQQLISINTTDVTVPRLEVMLASGRWRSFTTGTQLHLEPDIERMVVAVIEALKRTNIVTTQRNIYYSVRGAHPDWTYNGLPLQDDKVYNAFVGTIMEKVQLYTGLTMQSLGCRSAPRGYVLGDGTITTRQRGKVPLTAMPAMSFDLVDEDAIVDSKARKVIHFEKDAGFEGLTSGDLQIFIESMFSTSQGYLVESANKFLADAEKRGLNLYSVHDSDLHGISMSTMYSLASKSNAYMPESFYAKKVIPLGLFYRVAKELGLPPEKISETHKAIIPNVKKIVEENSELKPDVEEMLKTMQQYEFQALNGLSDKAPQAYLIEALRVSNDEIKYVPDKEIIKQTIIDYIHNLTNEFVKEEIENYAKDWLMRNLYDNLVQQLNIELTSHKEEFARQLEQELRKLYAMRAEDLREAVKLALIENPRRYWDDALRSVVRNILKQKFNINANINGSVQVNSAEADKNIKINNPNVPDHEITKTEIVEAIERRTVKDTKLCRKIRNALEKIKGKPSENW